MPTLGISIQTRARAIWRSSMTVCVAAWRVLTGDGSPQPRPARWAQAASLQKAQGLERLIESERAARRAAEREGRIKDEFLATLSHEIRTPLSAILGWAQITKKANSLESVCKGLEVIERNARAQIQMVNDLLDMSAIISGKLKLQVRRLDLPAIIGAAIENAKPAADARGIAILAGVDVYPPVSVNGDAERLQQVLWNLLSNAIKFTPRGGEIRVSATCVDTHLELAVEDNGEGIPADFLPFVFDRFRQADVSTTRRHGGLGLGLSIVRQITELHGGSVRASSPGPGMGSTFVVALPLPAMQAASAAADESLSWRRDPSSRSGNAAPERGIRGVRVLVVDDEPDTRDLIQLLLLGHGAAVVVARSAREAFDTLRARPFDVLICDIGMPEEDGYSLLQRVRALPAEQCGQIAAIALTACAGQEDRTRALSAGFSMHVAKPVEMDELARMVALLAPTSSQVRRLQGGRVAEPKVSTQ